MNLWKDYTYMAIGVIFIIILVAIVAVMCKKPDSEDELDSDDPE